MAVAQLEYMMYKQELNGKLLKGNNPMINHEYIYLSTKSFKLENRNTSLILKFISFSYVRFTIW
jgi:hypothetical protein